MTGPGPPHTVATLRDCPREDWLATHEDWLATGISTSFWRLVKTEHVRSSVPTSCLLKVAQSLHSVRLALLDNISHTDEHAHNQIYEQTPY